MRNARSDDDEYSDGSLCVPIPALSMLKELEPLYFGSSFSLSLSLSLIAIRNDGNNGDSSGAAIKTTKLKDDNETDGSNDSSN
jgi:hypothetical protein